MKRKKKEIIGVFSLSKIHSNSIDTIKMKRKKKEIIDVAIEILFS